MDEASWLTPAFDNFLLFDTNLSGFESDTLFLDVQVVEGPVVEQEVIAPKEQVEIKETKKHDKGLVCEKCQKVFEFPSRLQRHLATHQRKQYSCNGCEKGFSRGDVLEAHRIRMHQDKLPKKSGKHQCPVCPAQLASSHHYQRHVEAHQKNAGSFDCPQCGKTFENRRKFRVHSRHHLDEAKKFHCHVCDRAFLQMEFLRRHQRVHSGERPFVCTLCPATFRQQVHLQRHYGRLHDQEKVKIHGCDQCSKTFMTSGELKNHQLYHQPARLGCSSCHLTFVEKRHLDRHTRRAHGGGVRPHICHRQGCGKAFYEKYELNHHLKNLCPLRCTEI